MDFTVVLGVSFALGRMAFALLAARALFSAQLLVWALAGKLWGVDSALTSDARVFSGLFVQRQYKQQQCTAIYQDLFACRWA